MPIEEVNSERAKKLFDVNVFGLIHCSKEALIQMRKQESGIIVNILSTIALGASATEAVYCASKWAANGFTQSLRLAASPHSVKVLTVFPGGMKTNFFDEAKPDQYEDFMNPDDVARKIIDNIKLEEPEEELILRRPKK
jgi:short-subunit dehydrogenase